MYKTQALTFLAQSADGWTGTTRRRSQYIHRSQKEFQGIETGAQGANGGTL